MRYQINKIDLRNINLSDQEHKAFLDNQFRDWWREVKWSREVSQIENIWERNILYSEGMQTPVGFTNNYLQEFVKKNYENLAVANILKKDDNGLIYVIDNKIGDMIDAINGEYINLEKKASVRKDDSTRNNGIERAIQNLYNKFEEKKELWDNVTIPCIEDMTLFGLGWDKVRFNPYRNPEAGGDIDFETIDPRHVYPDPSSKKKYFKDARFIIHRKPMEIEDAKEYLSQFPGADVTKISADSDFLFSNRLNNDDVTIEKTSAYTDILFIEFCKTYTDDYTKTLPLQSNPAELSIGKGKQERDFYFYAIFNEGTGTVFHSINKNTFCNDDYFKFYLTPYYNKKSRIRTYPQSDVERVANLQDIINISKTLILDSGRKRNILRAFVKQKIMSDYGEEMVQKFLDIGGLFPVDLDEGQDIRQLIVPMQLPDMPREVIEFMQMAEKSFERQTDSESALRGEYPDSGMASGKAIENLVAQKRKKLSYKDVNINWAITQRAKKMYNIFATEFDEEMYIRLNDAKKEDPKLAILNGIRTMPEFEELLVESGMVDEQTEQILYSIPQDDPNYIQTKMKILKPVMKRYEEYNEVEYSIKPVDQYGRRLTAMQMYQHSLCFINMLSDKDKVDIKILLNYDSDQESTRQKVLATNLFNSGQFPYDMYLEILGGYFADNKEEILKKMEETSFEKQIANEVEKRGPEFKQAMSQFIQQYDSMRKMQQNRQKQLT